MKTLRLLFLTFTLLGTMCVRAQSPMWMAKEYIKEGNYQAAARQLRPLADGGDAEAQLLAAKLFLEGKFNTAKAEEQGVKYATMAADQGNEEAITLLMERNWLKDPETAFAILKKYTDKFPYLRKGGIGASLADCYLQGHGTERNEALGWQLLEDNEQFEILMMDIKKKSQYMKYKVAQAGKSSYEDYADYLFARHENAKFKEVCDFIEELHPQISLHHEMNADRGNAFSAAWVANKEYEADNLVKAREYLQKAISRGSAYGRSLQEKINYMPIAFIINLKYDNRTRFVKVEHRYDKTILHGMFKGQHSDSWTQFYQNDYLLVGGRKYYMTSTSKKIRGRQGGGEVPFTLEFKPVPQNWNMIQLCYNGQVYWTVTAQDVRDVIK